MKHESNLEKQYQERKAWFIKRIRKVVFQNDNHYSCEICKYITKNGLVISDRDHVIYRLDIKGCSLEDPKCNKCTSTLRKKWKF